MENKHIHEKVEAAMQSLDGLQIATANPYLLTRIRARLAAPESQNFWWKATQFLCRPAVVTACIALCIVFNFIALSMPQNAEKQMTTHTNGILNIQNQDLSVTMAGIYDFENMEP